MIISIKLSCSEKLPYLVAQASRLCWRKLKPAATKNSFHDL